MARGEQLARQWRLIAAIAARPQGCTVGALARDLNCTPRTIYRDLEAVQQAGFPLYSIRVDGRACWRFVDGFRVSFSIPFTLPELLALHFTQDLLKVLRGTAFHDDLASALGKIRRTLPESSLAFLERVGQAFGAGRGPTRDYALYRELLGRLNTAILERRTIQMRYFTLSRGRVTERRVDPYTLWYQAGTLYVIGHDHLRRAIRMFVVDRIRALEVTEDRFAPPPDFSVEAFLQHSFGVMQDELVRVVVRFDRTIAPYIEEYTWHTSQVLRRERNGDVTVTFQVAGLDEIGAWVRSFGTRATVLEPTALRARLRDEAAVLLGRYGEGRRQPPVRVIPAAASPPRRRA